MFKPANNQNGFTLVELLVSMALGLLVLSGLAQTFVVQNRTYEIQSQVSSALQIARAAMDMISRDLKMAGFDPKETGLTGISNNTTDLVILADLNGDGDTLDTNEYVKYAFDSTNHRILRTEGAAGSAVTFADDIQNFSFQYLALGGGAAASSADIRMVSFTIQARTEKVDPRYAENGGYRTVTLMGLVTPYNLEF
ncbi:MAG: prepilin-type N-terminal cleavage/methylation domain-containing protein [Proteobacteria bacterium]|nr:prepilin-type N-terminal cleavage/methylation domain-containing protein [Pseudomonadota bacterium]